MGNCLSAREVVTALRIRLGHLLMPLVGAFWYLMAQIATTLLGRLLWQLRIDGKENVPKSGAFLLCPVHRSNVDGPLTSIMSSRRLKYLAKESMFSPPWFAAIIRAMGAIAVNRGAPDRASLHACIETLGLGNPLVLFPEGTRRSGPLVNDLNEGAAYLAMKAGVPIVPVGIGGSESVNPKGTGRLRRGKVAVVIGEPLGFAERDGSRVARSAVRDGTNALQSRLQELFDEAQRRAGQPVSVALE